MNIRRGFFRVWVVLSAVWIIGIASISCHEITSGFHNYEHQKKAVAEYKSGLQSEEEKKLHFIPIDPVSPWPPVIAAIFFAASFPVITVAGWFIVAWVVTGFRSKKSP
jgi:hypothetical protein